MDLRKTAIISLYSINWLIFITETECVYCAVRTGSLYICIYIYIYIYIKFFIYNPPKPMVNNCTTSLTFYNSTFCPHSVFMCFVWISEQTAIISLYSIKRFAFRRFSQNWEKRLLLLSLHGTTRLPPDGFSWNLIFEDFSKICRENSVFIKISQE
jgi:hypothetical protein